MYTGNNDVISNNGVFFSYHIQLESAATCPKTLLVYKSTPKILP